VARKGSIAWNVDRVAKGMGKRRRGSTHKKKDVDFADVQSPGCLGRQDTYRNYLKSRMRGF